MSNFSNETLFLLTNLQWAKIFALIFSLIIFDQVIRYYTQRLIGKFLRSANLYTLNLDKKKLAKCIGPLLAFLLWIIALPVIGLPSHIHHYLTRFSNILLTLLSVRAAFYFTDAIGHYFSHKALEKSPKFDDILIPLLNKAGKTLILLIALVFIGESFNLNMKGLIAGLGIGGVAVAFAAKDSLANIFGSITILLDKPFRIGDNIKLDNGLTGDVIAVGLRSTRLRSLDDSIITVPNGSLTNANINNFGMRGSRRLETQILIDLNTRAEEVSLFCAEIKSLLQKGSHIKAENFHVYFNNLLPGAIEIKLIAFFITEEGAQELKYRHQLLTDILKLTEKLKIKLANPLSRLN